jgi:hypothetical protein
VSRPTSRPPSVATKPGRMEASIRTPLRATVAPANAFSNRRTTQGWSPGSMGRTLIMFRMVAEAHQGQSSRDHHW